jgi:dihydrofolate reductase
MLISAIVCKSQNNVIGLDNKMPWHLSDDLKNFKKITLGYPIVMGRKTFESIGKPLPGRTNIVLTRNKKDFQRKYPEMDVLVFEKKEAVLKYAQENELKQIFIIGGAQIYSLFWSNLNCVHLTEIHQEFEGDAYLDQVDFSQWNKIEQKEFSIGPGSPYPWTYTVYQKNAIG